MYHSIHDSTDIPEASRSFREANSSSCDPGLLAFECRAMAVPFTEELFRELKLYNRHDATSGIYRRSASAVAGCL